MYRELFIEGQIWNCDTKQCHRCWIAYFIRKIYSFIAITNILLRVFKQSYFLVSTKFEIKFKVIKYHWNFCLHGVKCKTLTWCKTFDENHLSLKSSLMSLFEQRGILTEPNFSNYKLYESIWGFVLVVKRYSLRMRKARFGILELQVKGGRNEVAIHIFNHI